MISCRGDANGDVYCILRLRTAGKNQQEAQEYQAKQVA